MSALADMRAIKAYLKRAFPGSEAMLTAPKRPTSGLWVIRSNTNSASQESSAVIRANRDLSLIFYNDSEESCITAMDDLQRALFKETAAQYSDGTARVRLKSLSYGSPVQTEGGQFAILGTLKIETRATTPAFDARKETPVIGTVQFTIK